ncbi:hypothetical protein BUALT_Bualt06G0007500 [Buddleja alternifolia]|uniref:Sister chromatid cohesion 1 protein 4-like n=1 Tax=Buddleja alternifolia TaxID=168488 RepID=A0AAV6XBZ2_9LAMI|nr:hypothetical protein BUALT_Bualt06G0007500 [Buddleja alternifolia]
MFYSQFILAKKGPLGTIWIAAHLERKLRKNQVADTDIGISVDSILCPDVPIALRLSSHLLLGVVRIYNRKVNYLFDDCSEALLKVKQAFRSSAVDLPPEESKAPYHSITLPETFDLDDFELPDNDIFQGNYVDHHISSREQITLQDTMEGVSYSTSKFGLDERFGDGDASGLDLDEELLLDKIGTAGHVDESANPQASGGSMSPPKQDEHPDDRAANSEIMDLSNEYDFVEVDGADEEADLMDYAQGPRTPGLVEEPNLSNVQDASACDDNMESEYNLTENSKNVPYENKQELDSSPRDDTISNGPGLEIKEPKPQGSPIEANVEFVPSKKYSSVVDEVIQASDVPFRDDSHNEAVNEGKTDFDETHDHNQGLGEFGLEKNASEISGLASSSFQKVHEEISEKNMLSFGVEVIQDVSEKHRPPFGVGVIQSAEPATQLASENQVGSLLENSGTQSCQETADSSALNHHAQEKEASTETLFLRPCSTIPEQLDVTKSDIVALETSAKEETANLGEAECIPEQNLNENQVEEHAYDEDIQAADREHDPNSRDKLVESLKISAESELPAPEKLLSVPENNVDIHRDVLVEVTPRDFEGLDEGDSGSKTAAVRKRSFTESTLTEQSLNSVESSRLVRAKRTVESLPDDDDLLSSILVGRKSSVLKVKPTPPVYEVTSVKRTRSAPRSGAPKRKMLMDDAMVLHGDTIRQQLTSTEDIRRVRKKAPCTRPEISLIQTQHLEDEIFLETIFPGMSVELASLHSQMYDLSQIEVCKNDANDASLEIVAEPTLFSQNDENRVALETAVEPKLASDNDNYGASLETVAELRTTSLNNEAGVENNEELEKTNVAEQSGLGVNNELFIVRDEVAELGENPVLSENRLEGVDNASIEVNVIQEEIKSSNDVRPNDSLLEVETSLVNADTANNVVIAEVEPLETASLNENGEANSYVKDVSGEVETEFGKRDDYILLDGARDGELEYNDQSEIYNVTSQEKQIGAYPALESALEDGQMNYGENPDLQEAYQSDMIEKETSGFDMNDRDEINYFATGNDTDFLNVDDDELTEIADDDDMPDAEDKKLTDNSGWSSRTRAVSKYLQTAFFKEAECGGKSLSMDNLLNGKSRKEASRMFFETLVLKTRDYIHVEQQKPFNDITIKPRTRLIKSDF